MNRDPRITALLRWYRKHGRSLPWRNTDDPYNIFISEVMLQQTQASRVIEFYDRWLNLFPTWKALANASTPDLLHAWAGLGYNRRALYLREAAKTVVEQGVPRTEEEWRRLKGVGAYTAAAVQAFVSHKPTAPIDTNIRRVIGRFALGKAIPKPADDPRIRSYLQRSLNQKGDWLALHALMDIGATICSPVKPLCEICPFKDTCKARVRVQRIKPGTRTISKSIETIQDGKRFPDRIYRGRILALAREHHGIAISLIGKKIDASFEQSQDESWLLRMIDRMKKDGLIEEKNKKIFLSEQKVIHKHHLNQRCT